MQIFSLFLLLCLSYSYALGQTLIQGRILDSSNSRVVLEEPMDGFCNRLIDLPEYDVQLDHDRRFKKLIPLRSPAVITLLIGLRPIWLVAEPGDTVSVDVDFNRFSPRSTNGGLIVKGRNGAGNQFFNDFNFQPGKKFGDFEYLLDSLNFRRTLDLNSVDYALQRILFPFDSLLKSGSITRGFYDLIAGDTRGILLEEVT